MGLLTGDGNMRLPCRDRSRKIIEVAEKRTVIDSTKAAIDFYENIKATTKTNISPTGDATVGFDVYVAIGPLKGPLFKTNVTVPCLLVTPTLEFKLCVNELQNWLLLRLNKTDGTQDVLELAKTQVTIDDKECFLVVPCDKLKKDEMKKMEGAYYKPGVAKRKKPCFLTFQKSSTFV